MIPTDVFEEELLDGAIGAAGTVEIITLKADVFGPIPAAFYAETW
jgi:hypothetical protein